jgi:hypothetical protein
LPGREGPGKRGSGRGREGKCKDREALQVLDRELYSQGWVNEEGENAGEVMIHECFVRAMFDWDGMAVMLALLIRGMSSRDEGRREGPVI